MGSGKEQNQEIYCPKCGYRPGLADRWSCKPGCGTAWNTFWTRALCPGCAKQWQYTWCPSCGKPSPHRRWYHLPGGRKLREVKKAIEQV